MNQIFLKIKLSRNLMKEAESLTTISQSNGWRHFEDKDHV